MKLLNQVNQALLGAVVLGVSTIASAVPTLQLGILGGTYNAATQTIMASGPTFSLFAFLTPDKTNKIDDTYYLSMAVTPSLSAPASLGSFTVNSNTVNVTSGMVFGTPPLEAFLGRDPGDLQPHGIFPTYFSEIGFQFSPLNTSGVFNTQDHPNWGAQAGSGMYYSQFNFNTSNLANGYAIHFDLYNTQLLGGGDIDITQFAPFSHDAESSTNVAEPGTLLLMGLGLAGIGLIRRRRTQA